MHLPGAKAFLVLLLLSIFFAQLLAPAVDRVRLALRVGVRDRPVPRAAAILATYLAVALVATPAWLVRLRLHRSFEATAATAVDRLASNRDYLARYDLVQRTFEVLVGEIRGAVTDVASAGRQAGWLIVVPLVAFVLLNHARAFRRSAVRRLPHGHLQWRADEYLLDVNSALAGFVRAQVAAGFVVALACAGGFTLIRVPGAMPLAAAAGVLELVPVVGPLITVLITTADAGRSALPIVAFLGGLRLVQDYLVYPRLVRRGMHLSSVAVIVSVWIGAAAGGAAGVLLALPAAGFLSVSARHWREYREIERLVKRVARERLAKMEEAG